ncbi:MAG TPA: hypothetical protein PKX99_06720, partial [Thermoanaerobaculia bacterium]|nr:hypothetical protein [Thermoanaerobaculia bacterium]
GTVAVLRLRAREAGATELAIDSAAPLGPDLTPRPVRVLPARLLIGTTEPPRGPRTPTEWL